MAGEFYLNTDGSLIIDESGSAVPCDDCPCDPVMTCPSSVSLTIAGMDGPGPCVCISGPTRSSEIHTLSWNGTYLATPKPFNPFSEPFSEEVQVCEFITGSVLMVSVTRWRNGVCYATPIHQSNSVGPAGVGVYLADWSLAYIAAFGRFASYDPSGRSERLSDRCGPRTALNFVYWPPGLIPNGSQVPNEFIDTDRRYYTEGQVTFNVNP